MKHLLQLLTLLICIDSFAQIKPVTRPYIKLAPALVFVKDLDPAPYISIGFGGHLGRFAALGVSGGFLKFEGANDPVIPLGLDLTITDFKTKKVQPVVTIQTCYPIYAESTTENSSYGRSSTYITAETKGQFMFNIGGGLAVPIAKNKKFFLTGSYGQLMMKSDATIQTIVSGRGSTSKTTSNSQTKMVTVSLTFML